MTQSSITALHGFLGLPSDWSHLSPNELGLSHIDASSIEIIPSSNLWGWAEAFNKDRLKTYPRILMGYSQGGRLAMHALLSSNSPWDAAVIISAHPGIDSLSEKEQRLAKSNVWATRFENEPWEELIQSWNDQEVFKNQPCCFNRKESDYDRSQLAYMLRYWSLGTQDNLKPAMEKLSIPLLWIAGENDHSYSKIATSMTFAHPLSKVWIAPHAGHRVPWEQPLAFERELTDFISTLDILHNSFP